MQHFVSAFAHPAAVHPGTPAPPERTQVTQAAPIITSKTYGDYRPTLFTGDFDEPCFYDFDWLKENGFLL